MNYAILIGVIAFMVLVTILAIWGLSGGSAEKTSGKDKPTASSDEKGKEKKPDVPVAKSKRWSIAWNGFRRFALAFTLILVVIFVWKWFFKEKVSSKPLDTRTWHSEWVEEKNISFVLPPGKNSHVFVNVDPNRQAFYLAEDTLLVVQPNGSEWLKAPCCNELVFLKGGFGNILSKSTAGIRKVSAYTKAGKKNGLREGKIIIKKEDWKFY